MYTHNNNNNRIIELGKTRKTFYIRYVKIKF